MNQNVCNVCLLIGGLKRFYCVKLYLVIMVAGLLCILDRRCSITKGMYVLSDYVVWVLDNYISLHMCVYIQVSVFSCGGVWVSADFIQKEG